MKKIFLSTFVLLLVGSAAVAQEKSGKAAAASKEKKTALEKKAVAGKSQTPAANAKINGAASKAGAVSAAASLVEYNAAKAN